MNGWRSNINSLKWRGRKKASYNCASCISTCLIDYFNIICYRCRRCRSYYPHHLHTDRQFLRCRRGRPRRESGGSRPGPPATAPAPPSVNVAAAGPARAPPSVSVCGRACEKVNACARGCEQDSKRATARPCACACDCACDCGRVFAFPRRSDSVRRSDASRVRNRASMCLRVRLRVPLPLRRSARMHERTDPHSCPLGLARSHTLADSDGVAMQPTRAPMRAGTRTGGLPAARARAAGARAGPA